ncbi:hypothetical protein L873DRAFT_1666191, partial [Choiromyces venosus 120613-1]
YHDTHERADVKAYENEIFLSQMQLYEPKMLEWDETLTIIKKEQPVNVKPIGFITHDECTFNSNDGRKRI